MGRRRKQLQDDLQEMTARCTLKGEALCGGLAFGRGTLRNEERNGKFKMRQKRESNK
jgi:hypothetical protein